MARGKKGSRKASRKAQRRANRKSRKAQRRRRSQRGGWLVLNPAGVNQNPMLSASSASHAQGADYQRIHAGQHGGGAVLAGAPVGYTGVLDSSLRDIARVGAIDNAMNQIQGMRDQSGGGRRRGRKATRKGRKASRKGRKASRKAGRKSSRKGSRRMRGGAALHPADYSAPGTLLSGSMASKALMTMNPEWRLAENPASFAPSR